MKHHYLLVNADLWAYEYLDLLDVTMTVEIVWNRRFRRTIAVANFCDSHGTIELSAKSYPILKPSQRVEAIAHEVCHLAAWSIYGSDIEDHGSEWCALMRQAGFENSTDFMVVDSTWMKGGHGWPRRKVVQRSG